MKLTYALLRKQRTHHLRYIVLLMKLAPDITFSLYFPDSPLKHNVVKMYCIADNPAPYCAVYPNALLTHPENCAQFFDCRQRNTPFGNYLRECPYLQLYDEVDKRCHSFQNVQCGLRTEPKAPCKYELYCSVANILD